MSFIKELNTVCDDLITYFGWKPDEVTQDHQEHHLKIKVFQSKNLLNTNYALAINQLYDAIPYTSGTYERGFCNFVQVYGHKDLHPKRTIFMKEYIDTLSRLTIIYDQWKESTYQPIIESIYDNPIMAHSDPEVTPEIIDMVNKLVVESNVFEVYKYKSGVANIQSADRWTVHPIIGLGRSLNSWIAEVDKTLPAIDGQVWVSLFLNLDPVDISNSNFIIVLHKLDSVWIVSDQKSFNSTSIKRFEFIDHLSALDGIVEFPYQLIENMVDLESEVGYDYISKANSSSHSSSWTSESSKRFFNYVTDLVRKDVTDMDVDFDICYYITSGGANPSLVAVEFKKDGYIVARWDVESKVISVSENHNNILSLDLARNTSGQARLLMILMADSLMRLIQSRKNDVKEVVSGVDFIHDKMIKKETINLMSTSHLNGWDEIRKDIFNGIIGSIESIYGFTGVFALNPYSLITKSREYEADKIASQDEYELLSERLLGDMVVRSILPKISELGSRHEVDAYKLGQMFNDRYVDIMLKLMEGKNISFMDNVDSYKVLGDLAPAVDGQYYPFGGVVSISKDMSKPTGVGIGKTIDREQECKCCGSNTATSVKKLIITHYRELMWVLNVPREELPVYYQNYRAYHRIPERTPEASQHPFIDVEDPCSRVNHLGLNFYLYMCDDCHGTNNVGPHEFEVKITKKIRKFFK
tara:strand:- start:33120 stop:35210 length:2091 start_codon:yes stop_codon:yes gene_type:complete